MKRCAPFLLFAAAAALTPLQAQTRASASYSLTTETVDLGGAALSSTSYRMDASVGGIASLPTVTAGPALVVKSGYAGQIYEFIGLQIQAGSTSVGESGSLQLVPTLLAEDATTSQPPGSTVAWSVVSGPITSISAGGLATAEAVYENTGAIAGVAAYGLTATFSLTVLNLTDDDLGRYAHDGLPDAWQVQYFGLNNPLAAPTAEPLFDGQSNLFKFLTGYEPNNPASRFELAGTAAGAGNFQLKLSQVQPGTRYRFQRSTDLQTWTTLETVQPVSLVQPFVQLLPTVGPRSFFRVLIEPAAP